jgi:hypothetical protein
VSAKQVLDGLQSLSSITALDPSAYAAAVIAETPPAATLPELEARDAMLTGALTQIEDAIARVMKVRLEHALADDTSIGPPTRRVFAQTVASYANDIALLGDRVRELAARARATNPDAVARVVVDAARSSLDLREALRGGVLDHVRALATAGIAEADKHARDTTHSEATRKKWSAVRRDHEMLAADPTRILAAPFATRIASWPEQLDEPAPQPEVHPSDLIELD